jgi:hypothetical protein
MKSKAVLALAAIVAALPLLAAEAPVGPQSAARKIDIDEQLSASIRALPAEQRAKLRVRRVSALAAEETATVTVQPGAFAALRARHLVPHERVTADPSITLRHVRKIDALCTVLPAQTRAPLISDATCAAAKAHLANTR